MTRMVLCAHCAGNGRLQGGPCFHCKGTGELPALPHRGHTLRIEDSGPWNGILSECSCGSPIAFITHEGNARFGLPHLAKHQQQVIQQWHRHRETPPPHQPDECTIILQGGPEDGKKITLPWETYRQGMFITSGPMKFSPPLTAPRTTAHAEKKHVYTVEQTTYIYMPDRRNPLIWCAQ